MTTSSEQPIVLERGKGYRCQVPGCNQRGDLCILDDTRDECAAEFEARLCEKHYIEARSAGQ